MSTNNKKISKLINKKNSQNTRNQIQFKFTIDRKKHLEMILNKNYFVSLDSVSTVLTRHEKIAIGPFRQVRGKINILEKSYLSVVANSCVFF